MAFTEGDDIHGVDFDRSRTFSLVPLVEQAASASFKMTVRAYAEVLHGRCAALSEVCIW
jgi:hypothetical protein